MEDFTVESLTISSANQYQIKNLGVILFLFRSYFCLSFDLFFDSFSAEKYENLNKLTLTHDMEEMPSEIGIVFVFVFVFGK